MTTTATGRREVPFARERVWSALTQAIPYCAVCDVSYVYSALMPGEAARLAEGSRFVCVPGRLEGDSQPPHAVSGEVVRWEPHHRLGTRLEVGDELWWTDIELSDAGRDITAVRLSVTHQPSAEHRHLRVPMRRRRQRMVQRTVDSELAKLPDHVLSVVTVPWAGGGSVTPQVELRGEVLHLRGRVDASAVQRLELEGHLRGLTVAEIDVAELAYFDSTALPVVHRWARRVRGIGGVPIVRGENGAFDDLLAEMGLGSAFVRRS